MERAAPGGFLWAPTHCHPRGRSQGVLRRAGSVGCPTGSGPAAGVSQTADGKDVRETDRVSGGASVRVFYLFYLRLVLLPHHLVRGSPPNKWWAECNETGGSGRGFPIHSCPFLLLIFLHGLVDYAADGVCRLPLHPLGGVGVGVQGEACTVVAQSVGEGFHVHAVLQGQRGEGMSEVC